MCFIKDLHMTTDYKNNQSLPSQFQLSGYKLYKECSN